MKRYLPVLIAICLIFSAFVSVNAEDGKYFYRACIQKNSQTFCPGSTDMEFSDKQLLYYRYNKPAALKQAKNYYNKAVKYENHGKLEFARLYYLKALDIYPYLIEAHVNLGGVYICLGQYDLAIEKFEEVYTMSTDYFPTVYVNLGLAYEGKKDYLKARDYYALAIDLDPNNVLAHNNMACVCFKIGEPEIALEHLKIVNHLSPGFLKEEVSNIIASN